MSAPDVVTLGPDQLALGLQSTNPLVRAVVISLFTWRRAQAGDDVPADSPLHGWWGDAFAAVPGDQIGSRLWLLGRAKLNSKTPADAESYAREALAWLVTDGLAQRVDVAAQRVGLSGLGLVCSIYYAADSGARLLLLNFDNVWGFVHAV